MNVGHRPTLIASFLHFDVSFMLWVLLGALGVYIAESLGLTSAQKGLMVAVPILSGALLRIPLGLLSDRFGGRRIGAGLLVFLFLPLTLGWRMGDSLPALLGIGLMLGAAGASFAVALPLASRWYPKERQGLVMGIAAAGNSGTVIANLLAPRLAALVGWHNVLALAMLPLAVVLLAFVLMAKEQQQVASQRCPALAAGGPKFLALKQADLWWFCLFYSVTFGGYVGLSSFLPIFLRDQYHVAPVTAGYLTAAAAVVGSGLRPAGGYLSDKFGGVAMLTALLLGISLVYVLASRLPALGIMMVLIIAGMACLGMGNGAVFQLVPQRFSGEIGLATGIIGAFGGLGGFFLPNLLGNAREVSGSFGPGLLVLAGAALTALVALRVLVLVENGWRRAWAQPTPAPEAVPGRVIMVPYLQP
ncbi:MAG: NarK/NasA family nitrate transporter [SAR202 cluster bacterium]|nr:NarK/NasA family nitrate transporter [SAR202 cluster bacterium]